MVLHRCSNLGYDGREREASRAIRLGRSSGRLVKRYTEYSVLFRATLWVSAFQALGLVKNQQPKLKSKLVLVLLEYGGLPVRHN